jgi:IS1 family transposase
MLDRLIKSSHTVVMNKLPVEKRAQIIRCLVDGNSFRSTVRLTGASKNTIAKLLVQAGEACAAYQIDNLVNLPCKRVQVDEIWSFVSSKQKNVPEGLEGDTRDIWTWTAICADTKLVPSWFIGGRDSLTAYYFIDDLSSRLSQRIQLSSDGHKTYISAVEPVFGDDVDYGMLVKIYGEAPEGQRRYNPCQDLDAKAHAVVDASDAKCISTSFAEPQNLTRRMSMRRLTSVTNAFSKKVENHARAIALHFMNYNFCRVHKTIKTSPAFAAGVADRIWLLEDVVRMVDKYWED